MQGLRRGLGGCFHPALPGESSPLGLPGSQKGLGLPLSSRLDASVSPPISFLSFASPARAASASLRFCNLSSCPICHLLSSVKTRLCQVGTVIWALRVSSAPNTLRGSRTHKTQARHEISTANHRQRRDKCFQGPRDGHPTGVRAASPPPQARGQPQHRHFQGARTVTRRALVWAPASLSLHLGQPPRVQPPGP